MPELDRAGMEALRQPLEDGVIMVSRVAGTVTFPAECMLVVLNKESEEFMRLVSSRTGWRSPKVR